MHPSRQPEISPPPVPAAWSLPLLLRSSIHAREQPVTRGVPFPRGVLTDPAGVALFDDLGREFSVQTEALARWPDGSVRWLLLDFIIGAITAGEHRWTLQPRETPAAEPPQTVTSREMPKTFFIETGAAEFQVDRKNLLPFSGLKCRGVSLSGFRSRINVRDIYGTVHRQPTVETSRVETRGAVRTTLCLTGSTTVPAGCRFVARVSFFAGTGLARLRLTLHNPNPARHRGGLWDLGDEGSRVFSELLLALSLSGLDGARVAWSAEAGERPVMLSQGQWLEIHQATSGGANWQSRNHIEDVKGRLSNPSFRGYRAKQGGRETCGLRASPIVSLGNEAFAVTVAVPEFWQQFPKALNATGKELLVRLFPGSRGRSFELQGGEQKTHTVWLHFGPRLPSGDLPLTWVHQPVHVIVPTEWYATSGAVPHLPVQPARSDAEKRLDTLLAEAITGPNSFLAKREIIDEYGWRHYGEVYADHENAHYDGPKPIVSHYNNQYDVVYGSLLQFFRTGDVRWWDIADPLARHVIDIDIYHTIRDKAAYSGGQFWHTDHYRDAATCTHRCYSLVNSFLTGKPYGGGPSCEHNYTTGLLHYYYLTGDPLAREAVLELADWVLHMDDGSRNILGVVEDGPTGLASATRESGYHGPGRGAGNSINALLDAWLLTGQRHYLDYAETLIRRCVHPADDIDSHNLLDIENRWSYTVFLSVLCRYLDLKEDAGELDYRHAYGRAALLHYAAWMEQHERPYFDQPEKLEYPTETWAAQELRKANVLRLAARYAEEPLRGRLLQRGLEFAERAWTDLLRFDSRTTTRPLAIMMREGTVDLYLRQHDPPLAPPRQEHEFGEPERFVPQRQRVKARLKSLSGLGSIALRLVNPLRWFRYLSRRRR